MDCREYLDAWLDLRQKSSQPELTDGLAAELRDHASSCGDCAQLERRMTITVGLLATLETQSAPEALDRAVRIEIGTDLEARSARRVARIFRQLAPRVTPKALDGRVAGLFPATPGRAPRALDRLVHEALRSDPPFLSGAPKDQDQDQDDCFDSEFEPVEPEEPTRVDLRLRGGKRKLRSKRRPVMLGVLLGLAVGWLGAVTLERVSNPPVVIAKADSSDGEYSFEVVVHDSFESLRAAVPELADMAQRLTGDQL